MLTPEERQEIEAELSHYPNKRAVCVDALKIIQRHRGWVSDESLRDLGAVLDMTADELDGVATFYNLDISQTGGAACRTDLRQRQLLDHGLRKAVPASHLAAGGQAGRDHRG